MAAHSSSTCAHRCYRETAEEDGRRPTYLALDEYRHISLIQLDPSEAVQSQLLEQEARCLMGAIPGMAVGWG